MFVSRLTQLPRDPATTEIVAGVNASVQALQEMLDVFFDYSRLDAQSTDVKLQPLAIDAVFDKLRLCFANSAAGKGLRLRIRPSSAWVFSEPVLLQRILLNLVSNALQYTPQGRILVSCRLVHGNTQARIEVWDSGIGIATLHHEKIFEEFFQVENPERDRTKGLGLGLSMVQRSCRLLNHPLTLRSSLGCGSRFGFLVPLAPASSTMTSEMPAVASPMGELAVLHVLLIEDDALGSRALQGLLAAWGCQVSVAGDAEMACELVRQGPPPDYVVSDYRLRGAHNGIDAIRLLRELSGQDIAACLISGDTEMDLRQKAQAAGLVLLQKPVPPAKLRSLLRQFARDDNLAS
jgi:CheY-like chemotaxis protein